MTRLLIYEKSYERVREQLARMKAVEPVIVTDDGALSLGGRRVDLAEASPEAAWVGVDLYIAPVRVQFMEMLPQIPSLKWVHASSAGVEHPIYPKLVAKGVRLTTSHGHAPGIAEYVMLGVLDHFQKAPDRRATRAAQTWKPFFFREVMGTNWLLIGFGAIGQGVAERARAFGCKITAVRRDLKPHALADAVAPMSDVPKLLPQADVVVLSVPVTPATTRLVNAPFLAAMKAGSVLVNVGRGALVDEPALIAALDAGKPEHAVLDVFAAEPLPKDSPFWTHPRVNMTCHTAGVTEHLYSRNEAIFLENLSLYLAGRPLPHEAGPGDVNG